LRTSVKHKTSQISFWCIQILPKNEQKQVDLWQYLLDAVTSSGILKAKQKLGVTFNFDKQDIIDLTKFSKMTMCRASEANSEK
jgi:hypothetical protein